MLKISLASKLSTADRRQQYHENNNSMNLQKGLFLQKIYWMLSVSSGARLNECCKEVSVREAGERVTVFSSTVGLLLSHCQTSDGWLGAVLCDGRMSRRPVP